MAGARYDLTAKVAPFLDSLLLSKIEEFNGSSAATLKEQPKDTTTPSLETAQQLYDSGKFQDALNMLSSLKFDVNSSEYEIQAWGKFAASILAFPDAPTDPSVKPAEPKSIEGAADEDAATGEEEAASRAETPAPSTTDIEVDPVIAALIGVQEMLDQRRSSESTVQLNRRAWLIHWALFAYFNGRLPKLVDTFFTSQYMSVIHAACPWVLRYVVVAVVVTNPRTARYNRRIKDTIRVVQQELYEYSDPVLEFVRALYVDFDFANVAKILDSAANLLKDDFFAHNIVDQFVDNARTLIANSLLRVHEQVPVGDLVKMLGLTEGEESKKWVADYMSSKQEAKLDAVFDETKGTVRVSYSKPSVYSQILEKVKNMDQRANQLQQSQRQKAEASS